MVKDIYCRNSYLIVVYKKNYIQYKKECNVYSVLTCGYWKHKQIDTYVTKLEHIILTKSTKNY